MPDNSDISFVELQMRECEAVLQYEFSDRNLLRQCLTHASVAPTRLASNERLEFLGDAILGIIVCELLFHRFPTEAEGELTRLKSMLVSRQTCADISTRLGIDQNLLVGKGISASGKMPSSIKAAVFESIVAGLYLDGGFEVVRPVVERLIVPELNRVTRSDHINNYKSLLQQHTQKSTGETPVYRVVDEKGPDHSKCFQVSAIIGPKTYPAAWGANKKEAEQNAAKNAIRKIRGEDFVNQSE